MFPEPALEGFSAMTLNSYSSLCDDFYLDMYINTELELPTGRDTILSFFERIQKQFPSTVQAPALICPGNKPSRSQMGSQRPSRYGPRRLIARTD